MHSPQVNPRLDPRNSSQVNAQGNAQVNPHAKIKAAQLLHVKGVRTVATVEFAKGVVVVLAGLGVFSMRHRDIWGVAESFLEFFHVNPQHHYVGVFIDLVYRVSDIQMWKIALLAAVYTIMRFCEAYGLWNLRPWAEWLALGSGAIYIPFEIADLFQRPDWLRVAIIAVNLLIVLYMLWLRLEAAKRHHAARQAAGPV